MADLDYELSEEPTEETSSESAARVPTLVPKTPIAIDSTRPMWARVLLLAWPVYLQQMLFTLVVLYDQYLAGNNQPANPELHVSYQAAQTTTNYLSWILSSFTSLISVGSIALVARFIGAGDRPQAIRTTHQSILLAAGFGCLLSLVGLSLLPSLIALLGLDGAAGDMAVRFLSPILSLIVFQIVEAAGLACLVGAGDTRMTLWVLGGVALLNMPLSWALLHGWGPIPKIGFPGITLGTALSHLVGGLAVVWVLARGRAGLQLSLAGFKPVGDLIRRLLRVSIPATLDSVSLGLGQLWYLALVNGLGVTAATAHGIAIRWEALGYLSGMAFGVAAAALVGQNLGAGRPREASHGGWTATLLGGLVMSTMGMIFFTLAPAMFRLFCPFPEQQPVIDLGVPVLRLVAFAMPPLAACIVLTHALRGAGDSRVPVIFSWVGFLVVRIPFAYLLTRDVVDLGQLGQIPGYNCGLFGAWIAMTVDLYLRGVLYVWRFLSGRWQHVQV